MYLILTFLYKMLGVCMEHRCFIGTCTSKYNAEYYDMVCIVYDVNVGFDNMYMCIRAMFLSLSPFCPYHLHDCRENMHP